VGVCGIFEHFSGFGFFLLPSRIHARPHAGNASRWASEMANLYNLYNKDCLAFMRELKDKSVDVVITDPPYGIERFNAADGGNSKKIKSFGDKDKDWNRAKPTQSIFSEIFRVSNEQIIFGMNNFSLPETEYFIVWDKGQKMPSFAECELAWCSIKKPAKIFRSRFEVNKEHPAQKSLQLMKLIIANYTKEGQTIFDPYMGSGTTGVAALELGRKFIGCEIDPKYFAIAERRIKQAAQQPALFPRSPTKRAPDAGKAAAQNELFG